MQVVIIYMYSKKVRRIAFPISFIHKKEELTMDPASVIHAENLKS